MSQLTNLPSTIELQNIDSAHHIHPFTNMGQLNKIGTRIIVRGENIYLYDNDGKKLLDAMSGLWCVNIGYGNTRLADVAARQMKELPYYNTFFGTSHPPATLLAKRIAALAPQKLNRVFFASSGSEANDTNIRLARHYWSSRGQSEKKIIISRTNSYHGSSMGSASLGGMKAMHLQGGLPIPDVIHINQPYWYSEGGHEKQDQFGLSRAAELEEKILEIGSEKIAAFIAEPVQGAGGVIIPPSTYWPEVQRICDDHNVLLIADEVICGFGRTGNWFGSNTFKIKPDIMTIAKGLSSGYQPIGGSIVSDDIALELEKSTEDFNHGYTYSGHPVAAAVALENINILEDEKIIEKVKNITAPYLSSRWAELAKHPLVGEARSVGMLGAIELSPDPESRAPFAAVEGTVGLITREICIKNGLIMRHVNDKMIISPPLIISKDQIDDLINLAWNSLDEAQKQIKAQGLMKSGEKTIQTRPNLV